MHSPSFPLLKSGLCSSRKSFTKSSNSSDRSVLAALLFPGSGAGAGIGVVNQSVLAMFSFPRAGAGRVG